MPNANGVFAEALVRLAQLTGSEEDRALAESALPTLSGVARAPRFGHMSILNALDLHLRGVTIVVLGQGADALRTRRSDCPTRSGRSAPSRDAARSDESHPARHSGMSGQSTAAERARRLWSARECAARFRSLNPRLFESRSERFMGVQPV